MFKSLQENGDEFNSYILVVDKITLRIISSFLKMTELTDLGVTAIGTSNYK